MLLSLSGRRVEIRGECYSSCTMYLGTSGICVHRSAVFGFHGPSAYGKPLSPEDFDYWSEILARQYREPLRSWFLHTARYKTREYYRISGATLIQMGYPSC